MEKNDIYRQIPRVDSLMQKMEERGMVREYGYESVRAAVREALEELRGKLSVCRTAQEVQSMVSRLQERIEDKIKVQRQEGICPVYNGTGIVLHTGLGRAPLGENALEQAVRIAGGYSTLEYDLEKGRRGDRCASVERLVCQLTGAEAAVAVNNNAAAVLLALNTIASGGEVIVSRGELVEIGGQFRIPDVIGSSGASLREVGTTNRTRLEDYESAVCGETRALLKVHTSNYRIVGFTESVDVDELCGLSAENGNGRIPVIVDLGSGMLRDYDLSGLPQEPTVAEALRKGADVVCFSGDKLMGGPQAGIIAGRKCYVERMKKNPLYRALRIDKMTGSLLENVLRAHCDRERALREIPVLRMLARSPEMIEKEAEKFAGMLAEAAEEDQAVIRAEECVSEAGGGSIPGMGIRSFGVSIEPCKISAGELESRLRHLEIPVIARVHRGRVLLDLRTFSEEGQAYLIMQLSEKNLLSKEGYCGAEKQEGEGTCGISS